MIECVMHLRKAIHLFTSGSPIQVEAADVNTALQEVLKTAVKSGVVAHGLHESAKSLDKLVIYFS